MDDEQRQYFATLMGTMEGVASDARSAASTSRETAAGLRRMDQRVGIIEGHVTVMHTHLFGKPPTSDPPPATRPLAESVTEHDGNIAQLTGQVIALTAKVEKVDEKQDTQIELLGTLAKHPTVQKIAGALATLALLGIGYATLRVQQAVSKLEERPAVVQPAPTVYLPAPAVNFDGGVR
jgi:hypothetical protein